MGNSTSVSIPGKNKVSFKLNFRKNISLQNALCAPDIHRNLISTDLLNKA